MSPENPDFPPTVRRPPAAGETPEAQDGQAPFPKTHVMTKLRTFPLEEGPPAFLPGETIKGRFVLREEIGRGGMSIVYCAVDRRKTEARDPNPLVAIKILNAALSRRPQAFMALQRETRKAQTLAHPNVATVFDFDRDGDRAFMSMELLRGRSLDAVVRESRNGGESAGGGKSRDGGMSREAALPIVRGIAEGLAYAHRKGIVHSDLKPANVYLTEDRTAKILDFGIARAMPNPEARGPKDAFDARPLFACTEAYATAEMLSGKDPHPADDVYALGIIVYQLFSGAHPFEHCSAPEAREKGLKAAPLRALTRREWRVLERSLSFDREVRPRDAGEFLAQFFGVRRPVKVLVAATAILALVAAYAAFRHYQETGPRIAFEALPAQTRQEFRTHMEDADRLWRFYRKENNLLALQEAVEEYANAYELHPGNRQATAGLRRVAAAALEATADQPQQRREWARALAQRSEYLARYEPIVSAAR